MMMIGNEVQSALGQPSKIIEMSTNDLSTERFKKKILQPSIHQVQHYPSISSEPHVQPVLQYREL